MSISGPLQMMIPTACLTTPKALFYYDQVAELTHDREFAAYNVFWLPSEQNMMYISVPDNVETTWTTDPI